MSVGVEPRRVRREVHRWRKANYPSEHVYREYELAIIAGWRVQAETGSWD